MRFVRRHLIKSAAFQEGLEVGIAAGEVMKQLHRILTATAGEQGVAEVVAIFALQATVLLEPFDTIGVEFFTPNITVIAGTVAARESV